MNEELKAAVGLLAEGDYTCVLRRGSAVITDNRRGIRPLLELWESGQDLQGFCAADRVVGKAAAFLYCLMGITDLYAGVISTPALQVLTEHGVTAAYGQQVPAIQNRTKDGFCPMETAVLSIHDPAAAPDAIRAALAKL